MNLYYRIKEKRRLSRLKKLKSVPMTYGQYCLLYSFGAISNHAEVIERARKPEKLCRRYLPDDLNSMTMGTLVEVLNSKDEVKMLNSIYNLTTNEIQDERADIVIGAIKWTDEQLQSITGLFKQLERDFTADEIMAGAEQMKGDIFSTINWFVKISNGRYSHDEALRVPWIIIWRCAKDERDEREYRERLKSIQNRR